MSRLDTTYIGIILVLIVAIGCNRREERIPATHSEVLSKDTITTPQGYATMHGEALLLTRFRSLDALQQVVQIQYMADNTGSTSAGRGNGRVILVHRSDGKAVTSILSEGISQADFSKASYGTIWDKLGVALRCPFAAWYRNDLLAIENLGRRRPWVFGKGDVAFYDMAETMVSHIVDADVMNMTAEDLSEKGYLNTFNHITAQAFMTSIFSEELADFVADVHERFNMPELISGKFTEAQLADLEKGPVDNYLDIINNEWGQELGKQLRNKYNLSRKTNWTPALLANYLNDIQTHQSWVFQIGFAPFKATDEKVILFANKINRVLAES